MRFRPLDMEILHNAKLVIKISDEPEEYRFKGPDGQVFVPQPLVHLGLFGGAPEVQTQDYAEADAPDQPDEEVEMEEPAPDALQHPRRVYRGLRLPADVLADIREGASFARDARAWMARMEDDSRAWRAQTDRVLRHLVDGQAEIRARLDMPPRADPFLLQSTDAGSSQQAGTSSQPPPHDTQ